MNPAVWNSLPSSACTMGVTGAQGPDRISQKHYDTESRVTRIEQGVGSSLVRDYATYSFTPNGQMASMTDARGFKASMMYDGFDRQTHWYFPSKTTTGAINPADYEQYTYDANGNRTTLRKRDGSVLSYTYDKLNRVTKKAVPARAGLNATHTRDVIYRYTIFGEQDIARFDALGGQGTYTRYDRYGRVQYYTDSMDGVVRHLWQYYNTDGSRRLLRHPDLKWVRYNYTTGGQFNEVRDHGNVQIADYDYDAQGRLSKIDRNSTAPDQTWTYDPIGRLAATGWANAGSNNVSWAFTRNPASQILTESQSNDSYSWDDQVNVTRNYTTNGLNQYTNVSGQAYCYDANGNLTLDGQYAYLYDVENRLVEMRAKANSNCAALAYTGQIKAKLRYDPQGRLHETENFINGVGQGVTRYLHDGDALVAEYNSAGTMLKRYIHGPNAGVDDPIAEYTGSGVAIGDRRNLYADARGSIALSTNGTGGAAQINSYDEYGQPDANNTGRFQYTGQVWLPEIGMYYYKARIYSPKLGRFLQTDPIGYEDQVNLYAYVGNDPINLSDPTGMFICGSCSGRSTDGTLGFGDGTVGFGDDQKKEKSGTSHSAEGGEISDAATVIEESVASKLDDGVLKAGIKGAVRAVGAAAVLLGAQERVDKGSSVPAALVGAAVEGVSRGTIIVVGFKAGAGATAVTGPGALAGGLAGATAGIAIDEQFQVSTKLGDAMADGTDRLGAQIVVTGQRMKEAVTFPIFRRRGPSRGSTSGPRVRRR